VANDVCTIVDARDMGRDSEVLMRWLEDATDAINLVDAKDDDDDDDDDDTVGDTAGSNTLGKEANKREKHKAAPRITLRRLVRCQSRRK